MNGINGTWKFVRSNKCDIPFEIDGHSFGFWRLHTDNYGYMGMADYPSDMAENRIILAEAINNTYERVSSEFDKEMANKIYYNAKHKKFTYDEFIAALKKEGIEYTGEA